MSTSINSGDRIPPEETTTRNLVVLLLDVSGSMGPEYQRRHDNDPLPIDQLNNALADFARAGMHEIPALETNGEIAIGTFGYGGVEWQRLEGVESSFPFYYAQYVRSVPSLRAGGDTPMAEAIEAALDLVAERKMGLMGQGLLHEFRPNVFMLTDGNPSKSIKSAQKRLHDAEKDKHVLFFALGTENCNERLMRNLAGRGFFRIDDNDIASYIDFVSNSIGVDAGGTDDSPDALKAAVRERNNLKNQRAEDWLRG